MRRERTVALAQARGGEWTVREARADLWLHAVAAQSHPAGWPVRSEWARRWSWTPHRVRYLVEDGRHTWWPSSVLGEWWTQHVASRFSIPPIAQEAGLPTLAEVPAVQAAPSALQLVLELDTWWRKYGQSSSEVRGLTRRRWMSEDILGELRITLLARQSMGSRFDARRGTLAAYVGVLARSRLLHLLERRADLVMDYDEQRHAPEVYDEPSETLGLELRRRRRRTQRAEEAPPAPRARPPAILRRKARERREQADER